MHIFFFTTLTWPLCYQVVNQLLPEAREDERIWINFPVTKKTKHE